MSVQPQPLSISWSSFRRIRAVVQRLEAEALGLGKIIDKRKITIEQLLENPQEMLLSPFYIIHSQGMSLRVKSGQEPEARQQKDAT